MPYSLALDSLGWMAARNGPSSDGLVVPCLAERQVADEHKCHVKSFERLTQLWCSVVFTVFTYSPEEEEP